MHAPLSSINLIGDTIFHHTCMFALVSNHGLDQIDAQEAERGRLARELHDNVGHWVAMISIDAEPIKQGLSASEKLALHSVETHSPRRHGGHGVLLFAEFSR
jgi:glucose-6-phosphate-specific signal transduction histidine kinase